MGSAAAAAPARERALSGGTAVWVFMAVEVLTFGLFLVVHGWGWRADPVGFAEGQARLHPGSAAVGTVLLLVGSAFAYRAVLAAEEERARRCAGWLAAAALAGVAFSANKLEEYADPGLAGVTLSTNMFWFGYLFITGVHLLHVIGGVGILGWLAARVGRGGLGGEGLAHVQAAAAYWHLVDVVWLLVFPVIYRMHP